MTRPRQFRFSTRNLRIRFLIQFHPELDETVQPIGDLRSLDNPVYDSIFTKLRKHLKFRVLE